jgi:hypothetical protein
MSPIMAIDEPKNPTEELNEPPRTTPMYVAWCDVMGAAAMMKYSFRTARFRVFQFYTLVMSVKKSFPEVSVYPAGDGVFLASDDLQQILELLRQLMLKVENVSVRKIEKGSPHLAFLVRAAVAHGAVSTGKNHAQVINKTSQVEILPEILDAVIVGPPVSVAYHLERFAPPMGITLDVSVLQTDINILGPFYRWSVGSQKSLAYVKEYFRHQEQHKAEYGFDVSKMDVYLDLAEEYFR